MDQRFQIFTLTCLDAWLRSQLSVQIFRVFFSSYCQSVHIGVTRSQRIVTTDSWRCINFLYVCMYVHCVPKK